MSNKKVKSKNIFIVRIAIMVLIIIIGILLIVVAISKENGNGNSKKAVTEEKRPAVYVRPDTIKPMFSDRFFGENTELNEDAVLEQLTDFTYYLIDNQSKLLNKTEAELKLEYDKNEEKIKEKGFSDRNSYAKIVEKVNKHEKSELSYTCFEIETAKKISNGVEVKFEIKLTEIEKVVVNLKIVNNKIQVEI